MRIYTKTGDLGETSLFSGGRVPKDHLRVEAYGTLDELSAVIGLICAQDGLPEGVAAVLASVQSVLLDIGAAMADPEGRAASDPEVWRAAELETWIDRMEEELEPLTSFILPGGSPAAAFAHLARTVCRRAERRVLSVQRHGETVPEGVIAYLNRLSDSLFVLARFLNLQAGRSETRWESPQDRAR
jgi:cob(I)alamin adenosyltransferase